MLRRVGSAVMFAFGGWIVACSGGDPSPQPTNVPSLPNQQPAPNGGQGGGSTESGTATGGSSGSTTGGSTDNTVADCIAACEAKYPAAAVKGHAIDQCWSQSCSTTCDGIGTGGEFGPSAGSCQTEVKTPSAACSTCTVQHCCSVWDACFSDADCVALNKCSIACYSK